MVEIYFLHIQVFHMSYGLTEKDFFNLDMLESPKITYDVLNIVEMDLLSFSSSFAFKSVMDFGFLFIYSSTSLLVIVW